jgi:trehalose 6-phosphate synthase/phosphatase
MAGAAKEMGEALVINPFHGDDFTRAIEQALDMPADAQIKRNQLLQDRLRRYDVNRWAEEFIDGMVASQKTDTARRARALTGKAHAALIHQFRTAPRRALLLDYDGTLVPFAENPKAARPDPELIELIGRLASSPDNQLAIVSGRPRADLEEWFGAMPVALIAEHGVWLRSRGTEWRLLRAITTEWKDRVRPLLQVYVDRLPGALLEEKEFSLAWHYRKADPEQASLRAQELIDDLAGYTRNIDVQVLEGNKVIEIRNTGVNKGTAAVEWLGPNPAEFIMGVGDDWTDEDLFRALIPLNACSVRVGLAKTAAQYHVTSHASVRRLLQELTQTKRPGDTTKILLSPQVALMSAPPSSPSTALTR